MGNKEIKMILHADDVILATECEDDLQRMSLFRFNPSCQKYGLKLCTSKTKSMVMSNIPKQRKLEI